MVTLCVKNLIALFSFLTKWEHWLLADPIFFLQPLKWELKRQPGNFSPPRGGYKPDDPNQQIVAEDIFDEYGGKCALTAEIFNLSSPPKLIVYF